MKKIHYITDQVRSLRPDYSPIKWTWQWVENGVKRWKFSIAGTELFKEYYWPN